MRGPGVCTGSDEQILAWADEAERGYDLADLPAPRPGRPPVGKGPGVAVTVRLDAQTLSALMERAALEGIDSRSDAVRAAVREWTHVACQVLGFVEACLGRFLSCCCVFVFCLLRCDSAQGEVRAACVVPVDPG